MSKDNTFLFTAYTGSIATAFGGLTTSAATFMSKPKLTNSDRQVFGGVRILVVDEVYFLKDAELKKMQQHLQNIGDPRSPLGGYTIVFSGDFQQTKPVKVPDSQILWHPASSGFFEHIVNCAVILEGMHCFRDDRRYREMLKRLCTVDLTKEDIVWINTRVLGRNGLTLPKSLDGNACYACPRTREGNTISTAIWDKHLHATHQSKESTDLPPGHIIIIEADISPTSRSSHGLNMIPLQKNLGAW